MVLLTDPLDETALPRLEGLHVHQLPNLHPDTYRPLMRRAHVFVVRSGAPLPQDILDDAPNLLGVVRHGVGLDVIPMDAARRLAIPVANTPGSNAQAVAEYGVFVMGMLSRKLHVADAALRDRGWAAAKVLVGSTNDLAGKTVGIVGVGEVGRRVGQICHAGFGMKILGHQRRTDQLPPYCEPAGLDDLFAQSDFVVLACPLTDQTRGLVSVVRLQSMKQTAFLVNLARGELIDTGALLAALHRQDIAGAALDVFEREPLPQDDPLLACGRVLLTPHLAARTRESDARTSALAVDQVLQLLRGEAPRHLVERATWQESASRRDRILQQFV